MIYNIKIGINGFGRIGKCCFYQLINNEHYFIKAINLGSRLKIQDLEQYLNNDTIHGKNILLLPWLFKKVPDFLSIFQTCSPPNLFK